MISLRFIRMCAILLAICSCASSQAKFGSFVDFSVFDEKELQLFCRYLSQRNIYYTVMTSCITSVNILSGETDANHLMGEFRREYGVDIGNVGSDGRIVMRFRWFLLSKPGDWSTAYSVIKKQLNRESLARINGLLKLSHSDIIENVYYRLRPFIDEHGTKYTRFEGALRISRGRKSFKVYLTT